MPETRQSYTSLRRFAPPLLTLTAIGVVLFFERKRPLRKRVEPQSERAARNGALFLLSAITVSALQKPFAQPLTTWVKRDRIGVTQRLPLPLPLRRIVAVLLLDYTLWWWHWMNHRLPFLWRFHLVHHIDRDLDATTAIRFHFGEMALSVPYRLLQIVVIGADAEALHVWQTMLMASILFHHSNVDIGEKNDALLARFWVTPRMHGIHHSDVPEETDSNWSSTTSLWDALHRTLRLDVPQQQIRIGVPAYEEAVSLKESLEIPFQRQRNDWKR
jgi:sterol desaturase/sphingolipid hydroxylase (fatty acid hydroxylase superfamily)